MADFRARAANELVEKYLKAIPDPERRRLVEDAITCLIMARHKGLEMDEWVLNIASLYPDRIRMDDIVEASLAFSEVANFDGKLVYYWKYPFPGDDDAAAPPSPTAYKTMERIVQAKSIIEETHRGGFFHIEDAIGLVMRRLGCSDAEASEAVMKCLMIFSNDFSVRRI